MTRFEKTPEKKSKVKQPTIKNRKKMKENNATYTRDFATFNDS